MNKRLTFTYEVEIFYTWDDKPGYYVENTDIEAEGETFVGKDLDEVFQKMRENLEDGYAVLKDCIEYDKQRGINGENIIND